MRKSQFWQAGLGVVLICSVLAGFSERFIPILTGLVVVGIAILTYFSSPTNLVIGNRVRWGDASLSLGMLLTGWYVVGDLLFQANARLLMLIGTGLLFAAAIALKYGVKPNRKGVYFAFKRGRPKTNFVVLFFFFVMFFAGLFRQLLSRGILLSSLPWVVGIISLASIFVIGSHGGIFGTRREVVRFFYRIRNAKKLFQKRATVLLGFSGVLIGLFTFDILFSLCRIIPDLFVGGSLLTYSARAVSLVGTICLAVLPLYIWWKTFHLRMSPHQGHLPDWNMKMLAVTFTSIGCVFFFPILSFQGIPFIWDVLEIGLHPGTVVEARAVLGLLTAGAMLALSLIAGHLDRYLRRVLMAGPFFVSLFFLGMFIYAYFVTQFIVYANTVLVWAQAGYYLEAGIFLLIFIATVMFFVAGFLSFLYEVGRD